MILLIDETGHRLFQRVIGQSGAALAVWALDQNPKYNARGVAEKMGCDMTDDTTITRCLIEVEDPGYLNDAHGAWSVSHYIEKICTSLLSPHNIIQIIHGQVYIL